MMVLAIEAKTEQCKQAKDWHALCCEQTDKHQMSKNVCLCVYVCVEERTAAKSNLI